MVLSDHWEFLKHRQVLHGMDLRVFGVFGKRKIDENAELTIDGVLLDMKDQLVRYRVNVIDVSKITFGIFFKNITKLRYYI